MSERYTTKPPIAVSTPSRTAEHGMGPPRIRAGVASTRPVPDGSTRRVKRRDMAPTRRGEAERAGHRHAWARTEEGWKIHEPLSQTPEEAEPWRTFVKDWETWKAADPHYSYVSTWLTTGRRLRPFTFAGFPPARERRTGRSTNDACRSHSYTNPGITPIPRRSSRAYRVAKQSHSPTRFFKP